jgi:shikimate dehydrogenase
MATTDFAAADTDQVFTLETMGQIAPQPTPYAVLGYPVTHSLSPSFQRAAFAKSGLAAQYHRIETPAEKLTAVVEEMKKKQFGGWNCTLPLKIDMLKLVDEASPAAKILGAVNTVLNDNGKLVGFNTDGEGWVAAIREEFGVDVHDMRVMILGAGGAGRALATQAALEKCERLVLVNRTFSRVQELAAQLEPVIHSDKLIGSRARLVALPWDETAITEELQTIDLLVNATSCGLKTYDPLLLPARLLTPNLLVYDTIYKPHRTKLLLAAEQSGARVANGLSMLLHQGAAAFSIWTGRTAPIPEMRQALQKAAGI